MVRDLAGPVYNYWIEKAGQSFIEALVRCSDLASLKKVPFVKKVAVTLWSLPDDHKRKAVISLDALRYDLALHLGNALEKLGFKVQVKPWLADLPSKTEVGMSRLLPDCELKIEVKNKSMSLTCQGKDFSIKTNRDNFLKEKISQDDAIINLGELSKTKLKTLKAKILAVFSRDIDAEGEAKGLGLVKDIEKELTEIVQKIRLLAQSGYQDIHIVTDHGFLLSEDEGLAKWDAPQGAEVFERRFAVVPKNIGTDLPAVSAPWDHDQWLVLPPARSVFKAPGQTKYLHGGASLQEMVIPYLHVQAQEQVARVTLTMLIEQEAVDSGVVKIVLKGSSPVNQRSLAFMPTVLVPRSGQVIAEKKGKPISQPKSFELGAEDQLQLTLFLERGLKVGDEVTIVAQEGDEILATKKLKVVRDV